MCKCPDCKSDVERAKGQYNIFKCKNPYCGIYFDEQDVEQAQKDNITATMRSFKHDITNDIKFAQMI